MISLHWRSSLACFAWLILCLNHLVAQTNNLNDGLLAYLPFDEDANDASGNGNHGRLMGSPALSERFGDVALAFDGDDDHVIFDDPISSSFPLTWAGWFLTAESGMLMAVQSPPDRWSPHLGINFDENVATLYFGTYNAGETLEVEIDYEGDTWLHIALTVTVDGQTKLFVNGQLRGQNGARSYGQINTYFAIGGYEPRSDFHKGGFDNIRIYDRALSVEEVNQLYDLERTPSGTSTTPRRAVAALQVVNGFVVGATLFDGGYGYEEPPIIQISATEGDGAIFEAIIENKRIIDLRVISPGSGYSEDAVLRIASPPTMPSLSIRTSKVMLTMHVTIGRTYQLQSSSDNETWDNVGSTFVAQEELIEKEFDILPSSQFFRIEEMPR